MMRKPVRLGIIGCGLMGREIASAVLRYPHVLGTTAHPVVVAVCDTVREKMDWFTDHIPAIVQATEDYRELVANSDVDVVYAAVPHHLHHIVYTDIIRSGKALLGEKPFGIDQAANEAILTACRESPNTLVRVASEFPYFPGAVTLAEWVRSGAAGKIIEAEAGFWHASDLDPEKPINWKRQVATNGEYGCMGDLGLHVVHLPLRLGWQLESVSAHLTQIITQRPDGNGGYAACDTWDNAYLNVRARVNDDVFPLQLSTKRIAPGHGNTWFIRVVGTEGAASFSTENPKVFRQFEFHRGLPQSWQQYDLPYRSVFPTVTGGIFEFGFSDANLQMLAAFLEEWAGNDPGPWQCVRPEEAQRSHALFTAALQSERERREVLLPLTGKEETK